MVINLIQLLAGIIIPDGLVVCIYRAGVVIEMAILAAIGEVGNALAEVEEAEGAEAEGGVVCVGLAVAAVEGEKNVC